MQKISAFAVTFDLVTRDGRIVSTHTYSESTYRTHAQAAATGRVLCKYAPLRADGARWVSRVEPCVTLDR